SAEAARKSARSRTYELLPDVDLEAGYMHMTGQTFVKKDSAFIGLRAGWQIWDWGARWYQRRAAHAQATAAGAQAEEARRRVQTDVAAKLAAARAAASALETGRANTTDLLDAQSALTQARLNFARARYEYALAHMRLARALGD